MPLKNKYLIFFDIDGTLIVRGKPVDFVSLRKLISKWEKEGIVFGINTNRPWPEAAGIYRALRLNGPVVVENGSVYSAKAGSPFKRASSDLIAVKPATARILKEFVSKNRGDGWLFKMGGDKRILKDKKREKLIFMTDNRKYTASVYVRRRGKTDRKLFGLVRSVIIKGLRRPDRRKVEIKNMEAGKIVIANTVVGRIKTMARLRNALFRGYNVLLISDEEEVMRKPFKNLDFGAVHNGRSKYKNWCQFRTGLAGVKGLLALVEKFIERK